MAMLFHFLAARKAAVPVNSTTQARGISSVKWLSLANLRIVILMVFVKLLNSMKALRIASVKGAWFTSWMGGVSQGAKRDGTKAQDAGGCLNSQGDHVAVCCQLSWDEICRIYPIGFCCRATEGIPDVHFGVWPSAKEADGRRLQVRRGEELIRYVGCRVVCCETEVKIEKRFGSWKLERRSSV